MAVWIVRIFGILITSVGGAGLIISAHEGTSVERLLLMGIILLVGIALVVISILAPRWRERTATIENCLGYSLKLDSNGNVIVTTPRDDVEARLYRGEIGFDEYAELVAQYEYAIRGGSKRAQLATEHNNSLLLSSEYADELEELAAEISTLRDEYAAGTISFDGFDKKMELLR